MFTMNFLTLAVSKVSVHRQRGAHAADPAAQVIPDYKLHLIIAGRKMERAVVKNSIGFDLGQSFGGECALGGASHVGRWSVILHGLRHEIYVVTVAVT